MDDFKRDEDKSPMPPSTRSERIGPTGPNNSRKNNPKSGLSRFFTRKWFLLVISTSLLLLIGGCAAIILSSKTYKLDEINRIDISSTIFGKDRKTIVGKTGSENREVLTYDQIKKLNPDLPMAFVKVEDERFFEHHGVDYRGFARAFVTNLLARRIEQGASTITMQVVGNVVLKDRKQNIWRKAKEVVGAYNLEREASKEKILEVYMNYVDFGNSVHGVQMASKIYFGKDLTKDKLTPEEIALLAGLPKAPSGYNPYGTPRQKERALNRRNVALMLMSQTNSTPPLITQEQKKMFQQKPLGVDEKFKAKYLKQSENDAYKDYVQKEIKDRWGLSYSDLCTGGFKIYSAMDKQTQSSVDRAMKNDALFQNKKGINAGATVLDSHTGQIIAVGGGRTFAPGSYNWATMKKQPGSSIKPLSTFGPVVQFKDYNEYTLVNDRPFNYHGWSPQNFVKGKFYGEQPLKFVVANSLNVATASLLINEVGVARSYDFLTKELEMPLLPVDKAPAPLALGGLTEGVSTVNMAQAYASFSNRGEMPKAYSVLQVVDSEGETVKPLSGKEINEDGILKRVFSEKTAWYMTRMLQGVVTSGTGRGAYLEGGRPFAGKTGSTQGLKEGLFVGYTPSVVISVVIFNEPGYNYPIQGGGMPARLASNIMSNALRGKPVEYFQRPRGVPEPIPPFQLKEPEVTGTFDPTTSSIHLKWPKQDERVSFEVLRSGDGRSWETLGEQPPGSTGYTDTSISLDGLPAPRGSRQTYYYRVVAIDSVVGERKTSKPVRVVVKVQEEEPVQPPDEDDTGIDSGRPSTVPPRPRPNPGHEDVDQ